ncbi:MAG TPA: HU family DNA-binding protein [Aggregatilineales bacterium]|nr:HU family DNA-binding protein [Anaerolineales bacterium]HRE46742.1 HU family DNA-binding protein [Aggregatilineales bacterium]
MTKTDLIAQVAKDADVTKDAAATIVNAILESIVDALKKGEKVTLTGFGTFEVRNTAARTGTNPRTKEKIQIPAGKRVSFGVGTTLREAVSGKGK